MPKADQTSPSPATPTKRLSLDAIDKLTRAVDDNLGRLAVLERLCWLMATNNEDDNNQYVDFGDVRERAFWHGLHLLAEATAEATEEIKTHGNTLYNEVWRLGDQAALERTRVCGAQTGGAA